MCLVVELFLGSSQLPGLAFPSNDSQSKLYNDMVLVVVVLTIILSPVISSCDTVEDAEHKMLTPTGISYAIKYIMYIKYSKAG